MARFELRIHLVPAAEHSLWESALTVQAIAESPHSAQEGTSQNVTKRRPWRLAVFGCGFTLVWALFEQLGGGSGVSLYEVVWGRYTAHLTFMLLVFAPRYRTRMVAVPSTRRHVMRSLLMLGMPLCFIWGTDRMPVELVLAVFWVAPLLLVIFAILRATERVTWHVPVAALVGWIGVLFVFHPSPPVHLRALVLPLGMAVCFALYIVMTRDMRAEPILPKMFHTAFWVCAVLTLCLPLFWKTPTLHGAMVIASIGVVGWFALLFLDRATDAAPAAVVGPVLFSNVVWSEMIQWTVRGTRPGGFAILGTAIIAGAVILGLQARWTSAE